MTTVCRGRDHTGDIHHSMEHRVQTTHGRARASWGAASMSTLALSPMVAPSATGAAVSEDGVVKAAGRIDHGLIAGREWAISTRVCPVTRLAVDEPSAGAVGGSTGVGGRGLAGGGDAVRCTRGLDGSTCVAARRRRCSQRPSSRLGAAPRSGTAYSSGQPFRLRWAPALADPHPRGSWQRPGRYSLVLDLVQRRRPGRAATRPPPPGSGLAPSNQHHQPPRSPSSPLPEQSLTRVVD